MMASASKSAEHHTIYSVGYTLISMPTFPVFLLYLLSVVSYRVWRLRVPVMNLKWIILIHNVCCVVLSAAAFIAFCHYLLFRAPSIYGRHTDSALQQIFFIYSFSKALELLDTVFMMLRHKARQVSALHVYHHASMLLLSDCAYRVFPWPCMAVPVAINSFVHILVYSYYLATSLGMSVQHCKRHLTELQLLQFFVGLPYCTIGMLRHGFCVYGPLYDLSMILLFGNFYVRNYWGWFSKRRAGQEQTKIE